MKLFSKKKVYCTTCKFEIPIYKLEPIQFTTEFPEGCYRGKCQICGAIFDYDKKYIKKII